MRNDYLGIIYTLDCPLECDFCCHPKEEMGSAKFNPSMAVQLIRDSHSSGTLKRVVFTGGEPFLHHSEIAQILREVFDLHLPVRMVTSAFWATSRQTAEDILSPLVQTRLDELFISTDPSHLRFVPVDKVKNATEAALSLGLHVTLVANFYSADEMIDDFIDIPESDSVSHLSRLVLPAGRARNKHLPWKSGLGRLPSRTGGCRVAFKGIDIAVYPDGSVYPCCSGGFNREAELNMGNVFHESLKDITERMWEDPFIRVMLEGGAEMIYGICRLKAPQLLSELPDDNGFCTMCQLCAEIRKNRLLFKNLEPVLAYGVRVIDGVDALRAEREKDNGAGLAPDENARYFA